MAKQPLKIYTGYHGCDKRNEGNIQKDNFNRSCGDDHWLGEGAYFFGMGISNPVKDAQKWARAQAWDNATKNYKYTDCTVLKAKIVARNPLDLTNDDGKSKVNIARDKLSERMLPSGGFSDNDIVCWLATQYDFDVLIQDFYIMFHEERVSKRRSRFPNVRVICVRYPDEAIEKGSIIAVSSSKLTNI